MTRSQVDRKAKSAVKRAVARTNAARRPVATPNVAAHEVAAGSARRGVWLAVLLVLALVFVGVACDSDDDDCICPRVDDDPPAAPRGLFSITGDQEVTLVWLANTESDVAGYDLWWNYEYEGEYEYLATVGHVEGFYDYEFIDNEAVNGETYFYAVTAFDEAGNESPMSIEEVWDTARPEGSAVTITNALNGQGLVTAGFDLSTQRVVAGDDPAADFHFEYYEEGGWEHFLLLTGEVGGDGLGVRIQDMGWTANFDEIGFAPPDDGWSETGTAEAIREHTYVLLTQEGSNGYYAKIRLAAVSPSHITFDWAFQTDPWNRQLVVGGMD